MIRLQRALLSGWDKGELLPLARALAAVGVEILATRGTATALEAEGIAVTRLEAWLDWPEILGGRVKTLHPKLHAGILAPRTPEALEELERVGSAPIDLVAVDLYPFRETVRGSPDDAAACVEKIDIGGVALIRAAAKNAEYVVVLPDAPSRNECVELLRNGAAELPKRAALAWAARAFERTTDYDGDIAAWWRRRLRAAPGAGAPRDVIALEGRLNLPLRYGENPHQSAAWYSLGQELPFVRLHQGREISWNNLLDAEAAMALAADLPAPAAVVIKHTNPCGAAVGTTPLEAMERAWNGDRLSAFGGVVALHGRMEPEPARLLAENFVELVAANDFSPEALDLLRGRKGLRILKWQTGSPDHDGTVRSLLGGLGRQEGGASAKGEWRTATGWAPTPAQKSDLELAWRIVAAGQSNAIAVVRGGMLIGMGAGQTSRVDAVHMALYKARRGGHDVHGAALASDGFFPFRDNVDMAAEAGIAAIVQPGGSRRDAEVISAAEEHGIAMVLTGVRCFRH